MTIGAWQEKLNVALSKRDLVTLLHVIKERTTDHAGALKMADKEILYRAVIAVFATSSELLSFLHTLDHSDSSVLKQLTMHCFPDVYEEDSDFVLMKLKECANDENWEVRETTAWSIGELIIRDYEKMIPLLRHWANHGTARMKRAVAVGIKVAAKKRVPERTQDFLSILTPMMESDDTYVKKNLGPFAIGDGLLRSDPAQTLTWLRQLALESEHPTVLCNVAAVFTSAESKHHPDEMEAILRLVLAKSRENRLQKAVLRACKKQQVYHPERVAQLLRSWNDTR